MKNILHQLLTIPKTAVFAFINVRTRRVYVSYSSTFKVRLMQIVHQLDTKRWKYRGMLNELKDIKLVILDANLPEHDLKVFTKYHRDSYRNKGYRLYDKEKTPIQYTFSIRFTDRRNSIVVVATTSRRQSTILGYFSTIDEAKDFLNLISDRSINPSRNLVYARNNATRSTIIREQNLSVKRRYIR